MEWIKVFFIGYILGSIPFGLLVGKIYGVDIRKHGSGNIGFTNVLRVIGLFPALFVLIFDALKGYLAVYYGFQVGGEVLAIVGAIASIFGHMFSMFLKFKGGKGVATGFGIIIFLSPKVTLVAVLIWLAIVFSLRYVSLASIVAAISVVIGMIIMKTPGPYIIFAVVGCVTIIIKHLDNIKRLLNKCENKISFSRGGK